MMDDTRAFHEECHKVVNGFHIELCNSVLEQIIVEGQKSAILLLDSFHRHHCKNEMLSDIIFGGSSFVDKNIPRYVMGCHIKVDVKTGNGMLLFQFENTCDLNRQLGVSLTFKFSDFLSDSPELTIERIHYVAAGSLSINDYNGWLSVVKSAYVL